LSAFKKLYNLYSGFTHYRNYRASITQRGSPMTKLETFRWRMWHVYLLIFITILLTGTFVRYGYRLQAAYSLDDRLYDYTNKKSHCLLYSRPPS
jgi:hypothetical protein